jgi:hypothetical protein
MRRQCTLLPVMRASWKGCLLIMETGVCKMITKHGMSDSVGYEISLERKDLEGPFVIEFKVN